MTYKSITGLHKIAKNATINHGDVTCFIDQKINSDDSQML